jgi:hypothetical protein
MDEVTTSSSLIDRAAGKLDIPVSCTVKVFQLLWTMCRCNISVLLFGQEATLIMAIQVHQLLAMITVMMRVVACTGLKEQADTANGPAHPDVHMRLFGKSASDIRVKLYRDHAAWCPYCQRV